MNFELMGLVGGVGLVGLGGVEKLWQTLKVCQSGCESVLLVCYNVCFFSVTFLGKSVTVIVSVLPVMLLWAAVAV